jgi:hypothetical protein
MHNSTKADVLDIITVILTHAWLEVLIQRYD